MPRHTLELFYLPTLRGRRFDGITDERYDEIAAALAKQSIDGLTVGHSLYMLFVRVDRDADRLDSLDELIRSTRESVQETFHPEEVWELVGLATKNHEWLGIDDP